jgi:amino acid adenylation domain-containing protein
MDTLIRLLHSRARETPSADAFMFLRSGSLEGAPLSVGALDARARAIAGLLQRHVAPGGRALLLLPPGPDFVTAFFGCLYASVAAVPVPLPERHNRQQRLTSILQDAEPAVVLTTEAVRSRWDTGMAGPPWLTLEAAEPRLALQSPAEPELSAPAFIQYTSGSTSAPKGVVITHGGLVHNLLAIRRVFELGPDSTVVSWLPLFHDMGLIGNVLAPLHAGARTVLMPTRDFIQSPLHWLEAISHYGATISGGPNSAFELCVRALAGREPPALELGAWRVAFNGSETVRAQTLERFARTFAPRGFRRPAFRPCYGLAEATLLCTSALEPRVTAGAAVAVSCGTPPEGHSIAIVEPGTGQRSAPGEVGEIWFSGPSVAAGYWRRPEETRATFGGRLSGAPETAWLRTGDLGFLDADGALAVTGRLKDIIILRGRNLYPADLEQGLEGCHPALAPEGCVVFSVEREGEEQLVAVAELSTRRLADAELGRSIRAAMQSEVADGHDAALWAVVLLPRGRLLRTTSGKKMRGACRDAFLAGTLGPLHVWSRDRSEQAASAPSGEPLLALGAGEGGLLERFVAEAAAELRLRPGELDACAPLARQGLDSMSATGLAQRLGALLGTPVRATELLGDETLEALARRVVEVHTLPSREDAQVRPSLFDEAPLSPGQEGLFSLLRESQDTTALHISRAFHLRGELDAEALRRAFSRLLERHPALRTTFGERDGIPFQRVLREPGDVLRCEELPSTDSAWPLGALEAEAFRPFDLEAPALRALLLRRSSREHLLLVVVNHLVADLWSLVVLTRDLLRLYREENSGEPAALPPVGLAHTELARRQHERLAGPEGRRLTEYWEARLPARFHPPEFPARPTLEATPRREACGLRLPPRLVESLKALGRSHDATLFTTLLAGWYVLLYRHTGEADLTVGTIGACRDAPGLEHLVGYLVNPLALRVDATGAPRFESFLERVRQTVVGALAHQHYPFPVLQRTRRFPLPSTFTLQQVHLPELAGLTGAVLGVGGGAVTVGGLSLAGVALPPSETGFDLACTVGDVGGAWEVRVEFWSHRHPAALVEQLLRRYQLLLEDIVRRPAASIDALDVLPSEEWARLRAWGHGRTGTLPARRLTELVEGQARRTPEATALIAGMRRVTYAELDRQSNRLAHHLRARGVGPGDFVAVCYERTETLIITLLAVLKTGAAYAPLDPAYPDERLRLMLEASEARLLLASDDVLPRLEGSALPSLDIRLLLADGPETEVPQQTGPEAPAYLMFTSGSTGRPKPITLTHANALNFVAWALDTFSAAELRGVLFGTSICFDLSIFEMFVPLSMGGTVLVAANALELSALPHAGEVTLVNTVPSVMVELLALRGLPPSVVTVNLAGEPLPLALARRIFAETSTTRLNNLYGPAETTTYSTWASLRSGALPSTEPSIGRPLHGTRVYVLDGGMRPVPAGVSGEVYIGGSGVALGYWGLPALTAERFVADPFSGEPGARLYRTGDLGRWSPEGLLEFSGRADDQVKVRGFRIEPGDIESAILRAGGVRETVVTARELAPGDRRLVAYVVPESGPFMEVSRLAEAVRRALPAFMQPSAWVVLETLPRLPHGKVDRRALPAPAQEGAPHPSAADARSPIEELLVSLWRELLAVVSTTVDDDFFALGGHSLLAARLLSRVRAVFGVELPLRAIFEAPTPRRLAERIARGHQAVLPPVSRRVPRPEYVPLSPMQQRLWFVEQLAPGQATFNVPVAICLTGELDRAALEGAVQALQRRHEALRTTFRVVDGEPVQEVVDALSPVQWTTLEAPSREEAEAAAREVLAADARLPFALVDAPPLRVRLLRLAPDEHWLLLTMHHLVTDGWSIGILARELAAVYGALRAGRPPALPAPALQYADVALWQRESLTGEALETQLVFWRRTLGGDLPVLDLPTDRPRPPVQSFRGGRYEVSLPPALCERLRGLGRRQGVTLYSTLLGTFVLLLRQLTHQEELLIGTPMANRTRAELEGVVGLFVNTVVLRIDARGNPGFDELLRRIQRTVLDAWAHQAVPFERVVEEVRPARDPSRNPLCQVMFGVQPLPAPGEDSHGLVMRPMGADTGTTKLDLNLQLFESPGGLWGSLEYNSDLFDRDTAAWLVENWRALLESADSAEGPQVPARPVPPLEESQLLPAGPGFRRFERSELQQSLVHRFLAQASSAPDRMAVEGPRHRWSYQRLREESAGVAHALRPADGEAPGRVALLYHQDAPMVAGVLGTLWAGHAYVPLDAQAPVERLRDILSDSGAHVLLCEGGLAGLAREVAGDRVRVVDASTAAPRTDPFTPRAAPEHSAYLLYTSGSTGRPKGVLQSHRNVLHHIRCYANNLRIGADDRVSLVSSYGFDAAVMDLYGALLSGAALCVRSVPEEGVVGLAQWLRQSRVTLYHSTPTVFRLLTEGLEPGARFPDVRCVVLGGEEALRRDVVAFRRHFPVTSTLVNGMGPTESTLALQYFLRAGSLAERASVPVGRPVEDTSVVLLDARGELTPLYGEVAILSEHLALGYWGREEETRRAFLPDPDGGPTRLYRTGDLARRLPDGNLVFVGRKDHQVKLGGMRIETAEVESHLLELPEVASAAVVVHERARDDRHLAAYVVPAPGMTVAPLALARALRRRLPGPMVPSLWTVMQALPLTRSGKVDRLRLPPPSPPPEAPALTPPRTDAERRLASLWCEVLKLGEVDREANFFELGGHSLMALRMLSRVRRVFGVDLPLADLFGAPTLAAAAARIGELLAGGATGPALLRAPRDVPAPLSLAQRRLWFLEQLAPGLSTYNLAMAAHLSGPLDVEALRGALEALVARHEALRTRFTTVDGQPVQVVEPSVDVPLRVRDVEVPPGGDVGAEARRLAEEEARAPFALGTAPLLRALLLRLSGGEHWLILCLHHLLADGWSMGVLGRELSALYDALHEGHVPQLGALPAQYLDLSAWKRSAFTAEVRARQVEYWKQRLAGPLPVLDLPTDLPRPPVQGFRGAAVQAELPASTPGALRERCGREGVTPFMVLLATFMVLLHRNTQQDDVLVGSPSAGRDGPESEGAVGVFVNTLVLRGRFQGEPTFRSLLAQVREAVVGAARNAALPFEQLVEALQPPRDASRNPIYQAMFVLQDAAGEPPRSRKLGVTPLRIETGGQSCDLTCSVLPRGESLVVRLDYDSQLFTRATAERLLESYGVLLREALAAPELPVGALPILSERQRELLAAWNGPRRDYALGRGVHERILEQVSRTPGAVAVVHGSQRLSYAALEAAAERVAGQLRTAGLGPGAFVPVAIGRSLELVVAWLGVLKAGAAFVPVDPRWPVSRLRGVLAELRCPLVLVRTGEPVPDGAGVTPLVVRADGEGAGPRVLVPVGPESPVYAIYTSGSTGAPKAAVIPHRGLANRFHWMDEHFGVKSAAAALQTTAHVYDSAVWQLLWPLVHGGRVVVPEEEHALDARYLAQQVAREGITIIDFVPGVFQMLAPVLEREESRQALASLRVVIVGGEEVGPETLRRLRQLLPEAHLTNLYGPTEASIGCIAYDARGDEQGRIPIGRPISNVEVVLLDRAGREVPPGAIGELHLAGACVGLGYLHDEENTRLRFPPNPFPRLGGGTLYRTGDLARFRSDGQLEFFGRMDRQVKLRGYRIEPGEIEAALLQHPAVVEAAVQVETDAAPGPRLVAWVRPREASLTEEGLRGFLRERLPEHMVPAQVVLVESLPLLPSGKVDRQRLRSLVREAPPAPARPLEGLEATIARLWCESLGRESVDRHANFFDVGGHSLLLLGIHRELERVLGRTLPVVELFRHPTIALLAAHLSPIPAEPEAPGEAGAQQAPSRRIQQMDEQRQVRLAQRRKSHLGGTEGDGTV